MSISIQVHIKEDLADVVRHIRAGVSVDIRLVGVIIHGRHRLVWISSPAHQTNESHWSYQPIQVNFYVKKAGGNFTRRRSIHLSCLSNEKETKVLKNGYALSTAEALLQYAKSVQMYYGRGIWYMKVSTIVSAMMKTKFLGTYYDSTYARHTRLVRLFDKNPKLYDDMKDMDENKKLLNKLQLIHLDSAVYGKLRPLVMPTFVRATEQIINSPKYDRSSFKPGEYQSYMEGMWMVVDAFLAARCKVDNTLVIELFLDIKVKLGEQKLVTL